MASPDELVEGQEYVVSPHVMKGEEDHPQLEGGELVTLINGKPDDDGEVYVTGEAVEDDATVGAWVHPEYLWTKGQAEDYMRSTHGEDSTVIREFSYIPHPNYPDLPTYETLPLGYALGVVSFIKDLGGKPVDPQAVLLSQYLQSRGFPTV